MEPLDPEDQLGYLLVRVSRDVSRAWHAALRQHGVNPGQFSTLAILAREPDLSQGELARRVMVTPQSMSDSIRALVDAGLLSRAPKDPGRAAQLAVTRRGRALLERAYPVVEEANATAFGALSPKKQDTLRRLLRELLAGR